MTTKVIGVCGFAGSGKDTFAEYFLHENWVIYHFTDPLKDMLMASFGLTHDDLYTSAGKARFNEFWGMTNREILQRVGTNALRNNFCGDVWIKIMDLRIRKNLLANSYVIIPDVRFDNEAELIHNFDGVVFRIERKTAPLLLENEKRHESEAGISDAFVDEVISNDGSLEDLYTTAQFYRNIL